jgi:hypothetical protein
MELSTSSNVHGILLTYQAKDLIDELTRLDEIQKVNKEQIFERLYALWTSNSNGQMTVLKNRFDQHQNFIKESIVRSFDQHEQRHMEMVRLIYDTLKSGLDFKTVEGVTIVSSPEETEKWKEQNKTSQRKINRRYTKLYDEFVLFLDEKRTVTTKVYYPLTKKPTKTNPQRDAKGNVDYSKMGGSGGDNKKKKGNRNKNKDNSSDDDFDEKLEVIKDILVLHNIKNTFTLYNYLRTPMRIIKIKKMMKMKMINLV